jgi:murein endopeptidase
MRPSRNRNWAHPAMIKLIERLATEAKANDGWNGLLVGDMSQPRGGPMLTGHASHQTGLDADVWLTPMPIGLTGPSENIRRHWWSRAAPRWTGKCGPRPMPG